MVEVKLTNKELDDIYSLAANEFAKASIRDRERNHLVTCILKIFLEYCNKKGYLVDKGKIYKVV